MTLAELDTELKAARLASYAEARAGWPVPLAGATYWAVLAFLGTQVTETEWSLYAAIFSGMIFPMAIGYAAIFRNPFLKVKGPDQGVIFMAMAAMLLFWPVMVAAMWNYNALAPLILAIGMSGHWPVFGWSYGRPVPFVAHALVRAVVCFGIWQYMPEVRFTLLPVAVSVIYLLTVVWLFIDSGFVQRRLAAG
ncbi:MAG: hypothetical protein RLO80_00645 [Hyphomonas sp.]